MKFLPKHNVTIYSNYSAEKVKAKLDENISYENNSLFSRGNTGNTYFTGYMVDNVFEVSAISSTETLSFLRSAVRSIH